MLKGGQSKMAKSKRGKAIKAEGNWRGTCPVCQRTRVKLAWAEGPGRDARKICKACYARAHRP